MQTMFRKNEFEFAVLKWFFSTPFNFRFKFVMWISIVVQEEEEEGVYFGVQKPIGRRVVHKVLEG